ncbi:hypothetical protein CN093_08670 [Sinorhizobium meliloti]|uniref:hypothetical protein n=1 Tax=Rhizobium meliloti TaxID=382 RepID=UPI000FD273F2|nr:hypothetical protein [Sinorhizobium meliloti]RVO41328.1 hypothetical protein CN093_08670 [Sinorhizobium meliloti]
MRGEINELGLKEFSRGELVRIRMTPEIVGQVIGVRDWGERYLVRLGGSTEAHWFEDVEIETYISAEEAGGGHDEEPQKSNSNIVSLAERRAMGRA